MDVNRLPQKFLAEILLRECIKVTLKGFKHTNIHNELLGSGLLLNIWTMFIRTLPRNPCMMNLAVNSHFYY